MRHTRIVVSIAGVSMVAAACGGPGAPSSTATSAKSPASVPAKPAHPVTLNILDIAGNLQLTKGMIQNFIKAHPDIVNNVTYTSAPAPSMAGKLQAQQQAGQVQTDLVLTGTDGLSAGIANNLLTSLLPTYSARFPNLMANYLAPAAAMEQLAQGYGIELVYYPSGPLLEYNPQKVPNPPSTPQELLSWAQAHPGKFQYADPTNSGPGRTLLMGLPYLLGDSNPKDPTNGWTKTWSYLQQLGKYISYYPSGTTETMRNLASGSVDMIATTTGWDINPRVLGTVPNNVKVSLMQPMHWVTDAQYAVVPKGVSSDVLSADLDLIQWMLQPSQQAIAYDDGYFYPGPAVSGVSLSMAPQHSQQVIAQYGRPEYSSWISQYPKETSLPAPEQVKAFDIWDRSVGSGKSKA
ncbi:extracellular solute-binding protein [Acidiferrimicrobium sp. IK]|uniref:extracellular solute-binding protein n=1 Tax=Acidiferrimicrobium sp. IK TaxID=2871700 RepID=UPI0021CAEE54|nr:extracellular solute-binding protein [Acidiferrimicrobium sp. IK]MCU4186892.1 extracellular solute-binding protein [Acidiferrimicrobium sp. IK]